MDMKSLDIIFSIIFLANIYQAGGQASSVSNGSHQQRMQRDNYFVLRNTQHGLLATWDQTQSREKCRDKHPSCPTWGHQGECHRNPNYMVPNCAYTCDTCLIGVSNNNDIRGSNNAQHGCNNIAQSECNIVTRENSNTVRDGIIREALAVLTSTVESVNVSVTNASLTLQGALAGKEILMLAAEAVASSAREYAMGCRDLSTMCPTLASQGNCTSNPAFMLVNCPISCNSCLPTEPSECVNKGDNDSCDLSAVLGLCELNFSYNLRFCSGSCKTTQSLRDKCIRKPVFTCPGVRSLRTPDFKCGVPLNRRKRLAVSIPPAQTRQVRRLRKASTRNIKKNKKMKRKRKQNKNKNISDERIGYSSNNSILNTNMGDDNSNEMTTLGYELLITTLPSDTSLNFNGAATNNFDKLDAVCCGKLPRIPLARQEECTDQECPLVCYTNFNCTCCDYDKPSPYLWEYIAALGLAAIPMMLPSAPSAGLPNAPTSTSDVLRSVNTPNVLSSPSAGISSPIGLRVVPPVFPALPIVPIFPIVPLVIAPVIASLPPMAALSGITSIPDTVATRTAARSLLPFCDVNSYLELVNQLTALTSFNTGKRLDPQVIEITRAINHCRHGVGQLPPPLATNITTETGFGNISHTDVAPPPNYPGVSSPGMSMDAGVVGIGADLGEEYSGIGAVGRNGSMTDNDRNRYFCGATLITNRHVLTAAHCLVNENLNPEVIRLGERDFTTTEESRSYDYNIKKITLHPGYQFLSGFNDIAVIELDEEVTVERSGNLLPYCLPSGPQNLDGLTCTFSGWGIRPNSAITTLLANVNVTVKSLDECRALYSRAPEVFKVTHPRGLDETFLCAAGEDGETPCRGDSGGPLVLRNGGDSKAQQTGIVSQSVGCGSPDFPGIYTRTDAFLDWLDEVVYQEENEEICS